MSAPRAKYYVVIVKHHMNSLIKFPGLLGCASGFFSHIFACLISSRAGISYKSMLFFFSFNIHFNL